MLVLLYGTGSSANAVGPVDYPGTTRYVPRGTIIPHARMSTLSTPLPLLPSHPNHDFYCHALSPLHALVLPSLRTHSCVLANGSSGMFGCSSKRSCTDCTSAMEHLLRLPCRTQRKCSSGCLFRGAPRPCEYASSRRHRLQALPYSAESPAALKQSWTTVSVGSLFS